MNVFHTCVDPTRLAEDLNLVATFLAADDFAGMEPTSQSLEVSLGVRVAEVLVLLGNSVLHTAEHAFGAIKRGLARRLLICGGRGHSTHFLYDALGADPNYQSMAIEGRSEADLLTAVASRFHGVDRTLIITETESSNCGENARFAQRTLDQAGMASERILLVQDPTMQRRSAATFAKMWQEQGRPLKIAHYPTFVPHVRAEANGLAFADPEIKGLWPMERFVSLLLGEIPRLRDDEHGYGPKGRGFIDHVEIPAELLAAHARVASLFPTLVR